MDLGSILWRLYAENEIMLKATNGNSPCVNFFAFSFSCCFFITKYSKLLNKY